MAGEIGLDLYTLLVDYVAGGVLLSLFIWGLILLVTCIMGRLSMKTILTLIVTYICVVGVGYVGALAAVPLAGWSIYYAVSGVIRNLNQSSG